MRANGKIKAGKKRGIVVYNNMNSESKANEYTEIAEAPSAKIGERR